MKRLSPLLTIIVILAACGTQPQLAELVNDMVVLTNFEETRDYTQYATYTMPLDTIGLVSNTSDNDALANDYAKLITSQIKKNLDQTNHTMVAKDANPDIGVNVLVVNDLSVFQSVVYPSYYYPSSYGYSGYYGYGSGYGYGYVQNNYFQQAVLVIEFVDLRNPSTDQPTVWVANIGDLVNSFDTSQKTKEAIDQAFKQSPFLNR
ncbi:MAG TPA: DUF4136 domain-containing protein [Cyclobacteriaceae bacterium]|nr:DUF4136 domain-containing protein [Cyclobacteriaceae bacterium]